MMAALAEICKLGLQLLGALLVARLTVQWALARYKSEKAWDRETEALADLLVALFELQSAAEAWLADVKLERPPNSEDYIKRRRDRFADALKKVNHLSAVGSIVFTGDIEAELLRFLRELNAEYASVEVGLTATVDGAKAARKAITRYSAERRDRVRP